MLISSIFISAEHCTCNILYVNNIDKCLYVNTHGKQRWFFCFINCIWKPALWARTYKTFFSKFCVCFRVRLLSNFTKWNDWKKLCCSRSSATSTCQVSADWAWLISKHYLFLSVSMNHFVHLSDALVIFCYTYFMFTLLYLKFRLRFDFLFIFLYLPFLLSVCLWIDLIINSDVMIDAK